MLPHRTVMELHIPTRDLRVNYDKSSGVFGLPNLPLLMLYEGNFYNHHILCLVENSSEVSWAAKATKSEGFVKSLFSLQADILLHLHSTMWGSHVAGEKNPFPKYCRKMWGSLSRRS